MSTHIFKLPESIENELTSLSNTTHLSKSSVLIEALKSYIRSRKGMIRSTSIMEKAGTGEIKLKHLLSVTAKLDVAI